MLELNKSGESLFGGARRVCSIHILWIFRQVFSPTIVFHYCAAMLTLWNKFLRACKVAVKSTATEWTIFLWPTTSFYLNNVTAQYLSTSYTPNNVFNVIMDQKLNSPNAIKPPNTHVLRQLNVQRTKRKTYLKNSWCEKLCFASSWQKLLLTLIIKKYR